MRVCVCVCVSYHMFSVFQISIPEEVGTVSLPIIRAQGKLGTVSVEWRTIDGTARSSAKSPPDFVVSLIFIPFVVL